MRASPAPIMALVAAALAATVAQAQGARIAGASIERFGGLAGLTAVNFRRTDVSAGRVGPGLLLLKGGPATFFGVGGAATSISG